MKTIYYYIFAIVPLLLGSCTGSDYEIPTIEWNEEEAPLSFRALEPQHSRVDNNFTPKYDLYTCAIFHKGPTMALGYYSKGNGVDTIIFRKMEYAIIDTLPDKGIYYIPGYFYPVNGQMKLLSFGVPTGKRINSTPYPREENKKNLANASMVLVLDDIYDGSFEIIAADSLNVVCNADLTQDKLPFAHFHFIQAHIHLKFKWAEELAADAAIKSRLKINSVRMENTPFRGDFYVKNLVSAGIWKNTGSDAVLTKNDTPQAIPTDGTKLDFGDIYVVPQTSRQRLIINYTIQNGNGNADADKRTMNYVVQDKTTAEIGKGWLAGHDYTYVIQIGEGGEFTISDVKVERFAKGDVGKTVIN